MGGFRFGCVFVGNFPVCFRLTMVFFDGVFLMGDLAITFFFSALGCFDSALLMGDFAIAFLQSDAGVIFFVWGLIVGDFWACNRRFPRFNFLGGF